MLINRHYWLKFFEMFFLLLLIIGLSQMIPGVAGWQYQFVSNVTKLFSAVAGMVVLSIFIAFLWQRSEKGEKLHHHFQTAICFYLAFVISVYGIAKILGTQFQTPYSILDQPIGKLNGYWLTWTYFGYSHTMALILGATQILGASLLLFRYTRLIGVFILLPVMVNIVLINHFYSISPLAYYNSLHYTFMLVFLMSLDFDKLKVAFLSRKEKINIGWKTILLNVLRVAVIGVPFLFIYNLKSGTKSNTKINGVWQVESVIRNNTILIPANFRDSVWSKIYFEGRNGRIFKYNPDKFQTKDLSGDYTVDKILNTVKINFSNQTGNDDSLLLKYKFINDSILNMSSINKKDTLQLKLKRIK
ncbi:MAG: hypothetical protein NTX03_13130 [Bacteroidetes bacterium]|nr:hypothetical protein [Bacteroidota bacterium]